MKAKITSEIMTRPIISAREHASARDVALQLITGHYNGMPVTDDEGKLLEVITEINILNAVNEGKKLVRTTASNIMAPDMARPSPDAKIDDLIKILDEFQFIRLPIVKDDKLAGIVIS